MYVLCCTACKQASKQASKPASQQASKPASQQVIGWMSERVSVYIPT